MHLSRQSNGHGITFIFFKTKLEVVTSTLLPTFQQNDQSMNPASEGCYEFQIYLGGITSLNFPINQNSKKLQFIVGRQSAKYL